MYEIQDEAAILVTIATFLHIVIPSSARGPAIYIDTPMSSILSMDSGQRQNTQSQTPTYALQLDLVQDRDATFYVNAYPFSEVCIFLGFKSQSAVSDVSSAIESRISTRGRQTPYAQCESEAINVSRLTSDGNFGNTDDLITDSMADNDDELTQGFSAVAVHSTDLDRRDDPIRKQQPISRVQEIVERASFQQDSHLPSIATAAIDVSADYTEGAGSAGVARSPERHLGSAITGSPQQQVGLSDSENIQVAIDTPVDDPNRAIEATDDIQEGPAVQGYDKAKGPKSNVKKSLVATVQSRKPEDARHKPQQASVAKLVTASPSPINRASQLLEVGQGHSKYRSQIGGIISTPVLADPMPITPLELSLQVTEPSNPTTKESSRPSKPTQPDREEDLGSRSLEPDKTLHEISDEFSLPRSPPKHGVSKALHTKAKSQTQSSAIAQKRKPKLTAKQGSDRPTHKTGNIATKKSTASVSTHTNGDSKSAVFNEAIIEGDSDSELWDEGLSHQTEGEHEIRILQNKGNQGKKRSVPSIKKRNPRQNGYPLNHSGGHDQRSGKTNASKSHAKAPAGAIVSPRVYPRPRAKRTAAINASRKIEHQLISEDNEPEPAAEDIVPHGDPVDVNPDSDLPENVGTASSHHVETVKTELVKASEDRAHDSIGERNRLALITLSEEQEKTSNSLAFEEPERHDEAELEPVAQATMTRKLTQLQAQRAAFSNDPFSKQEDKSHPGTSHGELHADDAKVSLDSDIHVNNSGPAQSKRIDEEPLVLYDDLSSILAPPESSDTQALHVTPKRKAEDVRNDQESKDSDSPFNRLNEKIRKKASKNLDNAESRGVVQGPKPAILQKDPFAVRLGNIMPQDGSGIAEVTIRKKPKVPGQPLPIDKASVAREAKETAQSTTPRRDGEKEERPQDSDPTAAGPSSGTKRGASPTQIMPSKRTKRLVGNSAAGQADSESIQRPSKTAADKSIRKTALMSSDRSGPKTQGKMAQSRSDEDTKIPLMAARNGLPDHPVTSLAEDPAIVAGKTIPNLSAVLVDAIPPVLPYSSQPGKKLYSKIGSQTRITAGGSPVLVNLPNEDVLTDQVSSTDKEEVEDALVAAKLDHDGDFLMLDDEEDDPALPHATRPSISKIDHVGRDRPSRNRKQQPSSPLAPSTFANLDMHKLHDNGIIINVNTAEAVVPSTPQDPFRAGDRKRNNSFIKALRKTSNSGSDSRQDKRASRPSLRQSLANREDPDKTLVELPAAKRARGYKEVVLVYSSPSSSSSAQNASLDSEEYAQLSPERERYPYEPHQAKMHKVLSDIVDVSS